VCSAIVFAVLDQSASGTSFGTRGSQVQILPLRPDFFDFEAPSRTFHRIFRALSGWLDHDLFRAGSVPRALRANMVVAATTPNRFDDGLPITRLSD
jgi:hypothetical protein